MASRPWWARRDLVRFQVGCLALVLSSVAAPLGVARLLNNRAVGQMEADLQTIPAPEGARLLKTFHAVHGIQVDGQRLLLIAAAQFESAGSPVSIAEWYRNRTALNPVNGRRTPVRLWCGKPQCPLVAEKEFLAEADFALAWNLRAAACRPRQYVVFVEATEPAGLDIRGW